MRVSKLFESICEPLLYRDVATDNLGVFLVYAWSPTMRRRFSHVQTLRIEFVDKTADPTYQVLHSVGKSAWATVAPEDSLIVTMGVCMAEVVRFIAGLDQVKKVAGATQTAIFPRLTSMAVGSIYGNDVDIWENYERLPQQPDQLPMTIQQCWRQFHLFLQSCPSLRHFCFRDPTGPLNIPHLLAFDDPITPQYNFTITQHFQSDVQKAYLPWGAKMRWVYDGPSSDDMEMGLTSLRSRGGLLSILGSRRQQMGKPAAQRPAADLEIYFSTAKKSEDGDPPLAQPLSLQEQAQETAIKGAAMMKTLRGVTGMEDVVRWLPSASTPICDCCGTGAPA